MNRSDFSISRFFSKFLSPKIVFAVDLLLSILSSVTVLLAANYVVMGNEFLFTTRSFGIVWCASAFVGALLAMFLTKGYNAIIRHTTVVDLLHLSLCCFIKMAFMLLVLIVAFGFRSLLLLALFADFLLQLVVLFAVRAVMQTVYESYKQRANDILRRQRLLVFGTSDKSVSSITRFAHSQQYRVIGFLTEEHVPDGLKLSGLPVFGIGQPTELLEIVQNYSIAAILFSADTDVQSHRELIEFCAANGIRTLFSPVERELGTVKVNRNGIRDILIEDLLGREEIKFSMDAIRAEFNGKTVLVTGAAGSIGSELCRLLASFGVERLIMFDNAETPTHNIRLELEEHFPELDFVPLIGDVRHLPRLDYVFKRFRPQVVFHAAAYKHVPLMEENPCEAYIVNVCGTRNVADKCIEYDVEKMVMVSTDKAVNPTNIMGCTKRLAEIYVQSLGLAIERGLHEGITRFVTTRFGNVLGSNGSVIPRFREQIEKGGPVTVTHPEMTRFFMTIPEACRLVMEAALIGKGNRIFVFDMGESVKIDTLARRMIELAGLRVGQDIEIEYTGLRPGEKLYEEILSKAEDSDPTTHDRIRIARVREYEFDCAVRVIREMETMAYEVRIDDMVRLMKRTVPEFKSRNSRFEILDFEIEKDKTK